MSLMIINDCIYVHALYLVTLHVRVVHQFDVTITDNSSAIATHFRVSLISITSDPPFLCTQYCTMHKNIPLITSECNPTRDHLTQ